MTELQTLRGMVDLLPEILPRWQAVEMIARNHFRRSGFAEIRTPLIESTNLFCRGIGEETDVVGKEMYSFTDRGNRSCTLRPEGTASVVRAVLEHRLLSKGQQRLWYTGPMFRYERPQAGRQRQFHQLGVEWLGANSPASDVEVVTLAWDLLAMLGVVGLELQLNTLGSKNDRLVYRTKLFNWLKNIEGDLDEDSKKRIYKNPLRILDSKNIGTQSLLKDAPLMRDSLSSESLNRFDAVQNGLSNLGIPFKLNSRLVRGLDYYGDTTFEITSDQLGAQATICGGGRYNELVGSLGGPDTPAIGWAIGMERLLLVLDLIAKADPDGPAALLNSTPSIDAYLVNRGERAESVSIVLARFLRSAGLIVELDMSGSNFSKQIKRAYRSGARWALVIGDNEIQRSEIRLKPLFGEGSELLFDLRDQKALLAELGSR